MRECRPALASLDLEVILVNSFSSIDCFLISLRFLIPFHFLCLFFSLLSLSDVFKFFKSYLSHGSIFSLLPPLSSSYFITQMIFLRILVTPLPRISTCF